MISAIYIASSQAPRNRKLTMACYVFTSLLLPEEKASNQVSEAYLTVAGRNRNLHPQPSLELEAIL